MKAKYIFSAIAAILLSSSSAFAQNDIVSGKFQVSASALSRLSGSRPYYCEASVGYYVTDNIGVSVDGILSGDSDLDDMWGVYVSGYISELQRDRFQMVPRFGVGILGGGDDVDLSAKFNVELRYLVSSNVFCGFDAQYLFTKDGDVLLIGPKIGLAF